MKKRRALQEPDARSPSGLDQDVQLHGPEVGDAHQLEDGANFSLALSIVVIVHVSPDIIENRPADLGVLYSGKNSTSALHANAGPLPIPQGLAAEISKYFDGRG
jgi:hypothetical protein